MEVDIGEELVGDEVEGLNTTVNGKVLGVDLRGGEQCCEEERGGEAREGHVVCSVRPRSAPRKRCRHGGPWRGVRALENCGVCRAVRADGSEMLVVGDGDDAVSAHGVGDAD